jgi:hypothetical protein
MKWVTFLLILAMASPASAQRISTSVIAAGGESARSPDIILEWTLGEIATETLTSEKKLISQGFHQPLLLAKIFPSFVKPKYQINVFPNPAQSHFTINLKLDHHEFLVLTLMNSQGQEVLTRQAEGNNLSTRMETGHLSAGVYVLNIRNRAGMTLQSFKIIKTD